MKKVLWIVTFVAVVIAVGACNVVLANTEAAKANVSHTSLNDDLPIDMQIPQL